MSWVLNIWRSTARPSGWLRPAPRTPTAAASPPRSIPGAPSTSHRTPPTPEHPVKEGKKGKNLPRLHRGGERRAAHGVGKFTSCNFQSWVRISHRRARAFRYGPVLFKIGGTMHLAHTQLRTPYVGYSRGIHSCSKWKRRKRGPQKGSVRAHGGDANGT